MSIKFHLGMLAAAILGFLLWESAARAEGETGALTTSVPAAAYVDDWDGLQARLGATNEEWSVIYPQLWRIRVLRDDVHATAGTAAPDRRGLFGGALADRRGGLGGALDSPMGGTSLNAPVMSSRSGGGRGSREKPFDPKIAPGAPTAGVGVLRGLLGRVFINLIVPDQRYPVQTVLTELQTLLNSHDATEDQIREKLAAARAVRNKVQRDLAAAQKDLVPYLTVEQMAVLVSLGYLD